VGFLYGIVAFLGLYVITMLLCRLIFLAQLRSTRKRLVVSAVLALFVLSLLPIYSPGMDPPMRRVNIIRLFQHGIRVGQ
jgi:hypothetical protein